jgi:hypothetical protein
MYSAHVIVQQSLDNQISIECEDIYAIDDSFQIL